ncbi:MAG TPA: peptide chain release factor N(5)-glutamine methyltransferase [Jatrophihabitans sp.]|nr:peptide chain release factor N(5)-glutamine methyltransferase [Jatrophihabitans sp.]
MTGRASVNKLLAAATERLAGAGVPSPRVDAELLLGHVLGVPRARALTAGAPDARQSAAFAAAVDRRATREPLQHIVGTAPFRHIEVAVGPGVFVPRPETELLVDAVLPVLRAATRPLAVDLCSGSGALALAIADEVPTARVVAVERPGAASDWLTRNAAGTRVEPVIADVGDGDLLADLLADLHGRVDAVVANPPYVPAALPVAAEVRHDPDVAVFAGADGLALLPVVIARAAELLRPGGVLAVEHADSHAAAVSRLLAETGRFTDIRDHEDLAGRPRYAVAVGI